MQIKIARFGLFLFICAITAACGSGKGWKDYQKKYAQKKSQASGELTKKLPLAIKTVEVPILGNRDRCTSCHLAIEDLQMLTEENPLRAHPSNYLQQHPPERFGCTVCHGGRGESLNVEKAHGGNFRKGDLVQTACSKCHSEASLQGAPNLTRGKSLMKEYQCTNCHYIRDFSETELFKPAPVLTGIGSKVNSKWLQRWLKDPKSLLPNATMPRYDIDEKYVDALVGYLMESKNPEIETAVDYPEGDIMAGKGALRMAFCITCHSFNERGGKEAPDLGRTGNKVHEKWLVQMLRNPHHFQPGTTMPQYNFSDQQISDIAAYVLDEFTDYDMLEQDDTTKVLTFWTSPEERAEIGRRIYKELRCANCHGLLEGTDGWRKVGPDLTVIGDKPVSEINFGNSTIPRALPDYLFEKIRNPQAFATPTNFMKMPKHDIPDEDIKDIVLALLSFNTDTVAAENYRVVKIDSQKYEPQGEFGRLVSKFRCFSCHSFKGRGHNITYDLTLEGSRVKREWLFDYLKLSYTIRPILTIRMPIFNMTDEEAEILTDGVMRETVSPEIPEIPESQLTSEMVDQGKILFEEKGCLACHQLERKGGYVGPSFTDGAFVGEKLRAGWVFSWLKDPQAIKPDVLEPNYGFTDEEALVLTAYIMSIKSPEK